MGIGKTLKGLLGSIAPTIGTAFGGPMGGVALKFLADKFTGGDTGEVEDFLLSANPAVLQELKLADLEFKKDMKELDVDLEKIAADNTADARQMAIKTTLWPQIVIAASYLAGYFGILAYLLFLAKSGIDMDTGFMDVIKTLLSAFSVGVPIVLQFFFGSSAGSKQKTEVLARNET